MNEQERSFEPTPEAPRDDTRETPPNSLPLPDVDIERLLDEGGPVMPEDD